MLPGIIVLGCHRSGTSLLADIVHRWGAYAGDQLLPADEGNPRGYWEYLPLVELNDQLLRAVHSSWDVPPLEIQFPALELLAKRGPYRERGLALLENMQGPGGPWVWKDPRLCLLLPFWKQLWGEVSFIVTVRDPLEIAESLHYRDDFSLGGALLLWELMTSLVLADPEILDSALFCSYEQLVDDAVPACARICGFLDRRIRITQPEADPRPALMANAVSPVLKEEPCGRSFLQKSNRKRRPEGTATRFAAACGW